MGILSSSSSDGGGGSQAAQQVGITARVMRHTGGRYLVGLAGLLVLIVGGVMVYEGATRTFEKYLRMSQMGSHTRTVVEKLGMIGTIARGIVIGLAGILVVDAAVTFRPDKARGLDGALRTLAAQPYGRVLLSAAALGLVAFGIYGFAEARWHRT